MRLESFNLINHAQWSTPNYYVSAPSTFGTVTGTQVAGRINQVGLKFIFLTRRFQTTRDCVIIASP